MGDHIVLIAEDCDPSIPQCRICHEEEDGDPKKNMESPCACSGTLKFAHRKCIQRWCDEKGNTVCEICLQKFEPGYTASAKTQTLPLFIRGEIRAREDRELQNPGLMAIVAANEEFLESNYRENAVSTCFRSVVLTFTMLLLVHHALVLLREQKDQYVFTILTVDSGIRITVEQVDGRYVEQETEIMKKRNLIKAKHFLLRASGILLPFYIIAQVISGIQRRQQENFQVRIPMLSTRVVPSSRSTYDGLHHYEDDHDDDGYDEDDDDILQQHLHRLV